MVRRSRHLTLGQAEDNGVPAIEFRRLSDPNATGKEGYRLEVRPWGITVSASQTAGLFFGVVLFWFFLFFLFGEAHAVLIHSLTFDDAPRFAWRGLMLDSVRHYQTPAFIKTFIDAMAREKLNVLQ